MNHLKRDNVLMSEFLIKLKDGRVGLGCGLPNGKFVVNGWGFYIDSVDLSEIEKFVKTEEAFSSCTK